ncbi:hypothetical protein WN51_05544 [Melipona quadrifasciata]|uniref:Uncharacterized protein n=1 Tax=Melipona quadrifasciata TaxID=166423 RepID=A0A0N0BCR2_9HYME|nr:hypothetical protein WN51_05544 [Melipona quadrifasciata]
MRLEGRKGPPKETRDYDNSIEDLRRAVALGTGKSLVVEPRGRTTLKDSLLIPVTM